MSELFNIIKGRRSVRTFDEKPVSAEDRAKLEEYIGTISNPFGIPVSLVLLDAKEHGLSSPVLTGESLYVAGRVSDGPYACEAYGYSLEKLVLYAWSLGIGTTWIGGTMKREVFEKAVGLDEGELMPCVSPLGYPAKRMSVREVMMRKGVGADNRMSADRFFFDGAWERPFASGSDPRLYEVIEMLRWAPSAVNKQPWRIIAADGCYNFFLKHDKGYVSAKMGDLQKVDMGIALCHFVSGLEDQNRDPEVFVSDPGITVPENVEYIATVRAH